LKAAKGFGLKTIYVERPKEDREIEAEDKSYVDLRGQNFVEIAQLLGSNDERHQ